MLGRVNPVHILKIMKKWETLSIIFTTWKVFVFGVILVLIFHIRTEYGEILPVFSPNCGKMWTRITPNTDTLRSAWGLQTWPGRILASERLIAHLFQIRHVMVCMFFPEYFNASFLFSKLNYKKDKTYCYVD